MSLKGFEVKYRRWVQGIEGLEGPAPFMRPGKSKGLLIAHTVHPIEYQADASRAPTVAGLRVGMLEHYFVDGKLYSISVSWPLGSYGIVLRAAKAKYGKPDLESEEVEGHRAIWRNDVSTLVITESGAKRCSRLVMVHNELLKLAKERAHPAAGEDP
jgi:hypothetical protein